MNETASSRAVLHWLAFASGLAALSWQVIWQLKSGLALGVSAWGAALTLATTMGGMCLGALLIHGVLARFRPQRPVRIYGGMEIVIGLLGLLLTPAFRLVEHIDTIAYTSWPGSETAIHLFGIAIATGLPAVFMGATLPVFGLAARQFNTSLSRLYGLNTLGAAAGALLAAFLLIPLLGVTHAIWAIAAVNIAVGVGCWLLAPGRMPDRESADASIPAHKPSFSLRVSSVIVFATGLATFMLEVAWFRSLTAAFRSTTDAFAIMLAAVLLALGAGASALPLFRMRNVSIGGLLMMACILILAATPLIERFDLITNSSPDTLGAVIWRMMHMFAMTLLVIGAPIFCLGIALPWILDEQTTPRRWGGLYALNAFAAIIGSLAAGWLLLPTIGFARTAWLAAAIVGLTGFALLPVGKRLPYGLIAACAFALAFFGASGVGTSRVQGWQVFRTLKPTRILQSFEGPDATTSAVEYEDGQRAIVIDGFVATVQSSGKGQSLNENYMAWMGHLPMLLNPDPKQALVICFGTGQTANAVRQENPEHLEIVDINPRVFQLAPNFTTNENVLGDPRVHTTLMDGRAFIRRTQQRFDVITLEPMPPTFAGVNALYSREFYQLARQKLNAHGVIAQWVPFHLVAPEYGASIARTFQAVFPNAIMWADPQSGTGILLGSTDDNADLESTWPGLARAYSGRRGLTDAQIRSAVLMDRAEVERYASHGKIIDDDNQLLAYGDASYRSRIAGQQNANYKLMQALGIERP